MDVGAGSGILSLFAAQASNMLFLMRLNQKVAVSEGTGSSKQLSAGEDI